jgi:hypothetical protein
VRCEEVRPLLPGLADEAEPPDPSVAEHLSTCSSCSEELAGYRLLLLDLALLRHSLVAVPLGFLGRVLDHLPDTGERHLIGRVASDERVQHAALSVGGAMVGAAAIGLLWWRAARRGLGGEIRSAAPVG